MTEYDNRHFETNIYAHKYSFLNNLKEIFRYKDLIYLWVRRDFISNYKQTLLGPFWAILQPIITNLVYTFVFGNIADLAPQGYPKILFFMSGQILWNYFVNSVTSISSTFNNNAYIIDKVYFPRLILPIINLIYHLINLMINFVIFMIFYGFYVLCGTDISIQSSVLLLPLIIVHLGILALSSGLFMTCLTVKFKDFYMLINYAMNFWMYVTPIFYDIKIIPENIRNIFMLNPVTPAILIMRNIFFNDVFPDMSICLIAVILNIVLLIISLKVFNKVEKTFVDTI